jgi:hypothetical protein
MRYLLLSLHIGCVPTFPPALIQQLSHGNICIRVFSVKTGYAQECNIDSYVREATMKQPVFIPPKMVLKYHPKSKRSSGRPLK